MPLTQHRHYVVGYHDNNNKKYEICEYAMSAYEAIEHCKEDVSCLKDHPHFVDYCNNEEVDNISRMMASGIPMGR